MELARSTSRGGFFVRSIFTFVLTVIITALLWAAFSGPTAHAASDANWNGESILYDGHQYYAAPEAKAGESHGLAQGTHYYVYVETVANQSPTQQKAHVIYFAPGSDPPTTTTASYVVYDFANKVFSSPGAQKSISIDKKGTADQLATSCAIEGVGWIVCSVSVFLAQGMDWVFNVLASFIAVQPPKTGDTNGDLFIAWNVMRSFANIAFIIVFIIIIYSQLTGAGITNYGLKKLLPRLIIAAVLVNLSYYICAIAIDLSNVIGYSLQDIFIQIRNNVFNIDNDTWTSDVISWESVTGFVLSGGTATAALGVGATIAFLGAAGGSIVSVIFLLLPALLALLLAVLVVLVILAARQAIIVLLLIVSPLAFVAYLLPNTEKWFEKWRELFMTMLIFFPAFSLVFGGSQLAGAVIIQNASNITVMILGMIVQVAPLVITPLLLKLSGSLLGRIAGLVNDPRKGVLDRTRNWANANAAYHAQRVRNGQRLNRQPLVPGQPGALRRRNVIRRAARNFNEVNRRLEDNTKNANALGDNVYHSSARYQAIHTEAHGIEIDKGTIDNRLKTHVQRDINTIGSQMHVQNLRLEDSKLELDTITAETSRQIDEYKSGRAVRTGEMDALMRNMKQNVSRLASEKQGAQSAQLIQQRNISTAFTDGSVASQALLRVAGSVDPNGIVRAVANAQASLAKLEKEALDNSVQMTTGEAAAANMNAVDYAKAIVNDVELGYGNTHNAQTIEAALEIVAQDGQVGLLRKARRSANFDQSVLTKLFSRNAGTMKAKGAFDLQADPSLALVSAEEMNASVASSLGDTAADTIKDQKGGWWGEVSKTIGDIITDTTSLPATHPRRARGEEGLYKTYRNVTTALQNPDIRAGLGDRLDETVAIHRALHAHFLATNPASTVGKDVIYADFI